MSGNTPPFRGATILQASGMVSVQAHCTPDEALVLMETRASETHVTLAEIAASVIDHSITFAQ
jgi:AmiR/NasT family two-component response regulator